MAVKTGHADSSMKQSEINGKIKGKKRKVWDGMSSLQIICISCKEKMVDFSNLFKSVFLDRCIPVWYAGCLS